MVKGRNNNATKERKSAGESGLPRQNENQPSTGPVVCYRCRETVEPINDKHPNCMTHCIAGVLFIIGLPFLVFIPYCFNCIGKDVQRCPKCGCYIDDPPPRPTANSTTPAVGAQS